MTVSFFHSISQLRGKSDDEILQACEEIHPGLFSQLEDQQEDPFPEGSIGYIVMYIIFAYSKESPKVVMGVGIRGSKEVIAQYLDIPERFLYLTVELKHRTVRKVIMEFLEYQADRDFQHMMRKRDMYEAMANQQMTDLMDDKGNVDYKAMQESSKQMSVLLTEIESCEAKIADRFAFVFDNVKDIHRISDGKVGSLRIEDSKFIK